MDSAATVARSQGLSPADLAWDTAPAKLAESSPGIEGVPDMGWDFAPIEKGRA
ncbi:hypothetical protein [Streptomyces sp. NPDC007346]|uniref:hypothetical protein n=1 Tax=Streptomyces sp. NPDC007346 TaxID=3154682 RepID=UPI0034545755